MKMHKLIKRADILTLANSAAGLVSIFFALQWKWSYAAWALLVAVVFDYLDGKVARLLHEENLMGRELDSLSDVISFGVAPAVFAFSLFVAAGSGLPLVGMAAVCVLFLSCGSLRLARFNISFVKGMYEGMPITANGLVVPLLWFLSAPLWLYPLFLVVSSALMISSVRIMKIV